MLIRFMMVMENIKKLMRREMLINICFLILKVDKKGDEDRGKSCFIEFDFCC